jgi:hypothetical protein
MGTGFSNGRTSYASNRGSEGREASRRDDFKVVDSQFEATINDMIAERLKQYNDRDTNQINRHIDDITSILQDEHEESFKTLHGGSVSKHTYIDGISDVDTLLLLDESTLSEYTPDTVKRKVAELLRERLSGVYEVRTGSLCVTAVFKDGCEVQLLPAMRRKSGIVIQELGQNTWSGIIHPERFAQKLSDENKRANGKLVPVIKALKGINAGLSPEKQLSGYHIESMAIEAMKGYDPDGKSYKNILEHTCNRFCELVMAPITDKTGQSYHVDDYLGPTNSSARVSRQRALRNVVRRMKNGNENKDRDEWDNLLGGPD